MACFFQNIEIGLHHHDYNKLSEVYDWLNQCGLEEELARHGGGEIILTNRDTNDVPPAKKKRPAKRRRK